LRFERYLGFGRGFERRWWEDPEPCAHSIALRYGNTARFGTGANMAFRRSALAIVGGFDPALDAGTLTHGGGDLDMFFRIIKARGTLVYEPAAVVRHEHRRDMHELEEQLSNWATAMRSYAERNRFNHPEERLPFALLVHGLLATWHLRRLLWSVVDRELSTPLAIKEIIGLGGGHERYHQARAVADEIARRCGPSVPAPRVTRRATRAGTRVTSEVADHVIDLAAPLEPFTHPGTANIVRLAITFKGSPVTTTSLVHCGRTTSVARLRDVIARSAGPKICGLPAGVRLRSAAERDLAEGILSALQERAERMRRRAGRPRRGPLHASTARQR
jgi:O-antigen biosynthesis protein